MAFDMPKADYWVDVPPSEFEYGRSYRLVSYGGEDMTPVVEIPSTSHSGSIAPGEGLIGRSNMESIENDQSLQDKVAYGDMGSYRSVIIPADREPAREVIDIFSALADYPLLDDGLHSRMESELAKESWDEWGRRDFVRNVLWIPVQKVVENEMGEETDKDDITDVLDDHDDEVDKVWENINGWEFQTIESEGTYFHFKEAEKVFTKASDERLMEILEPVISLFYPLPSEVVSPL